MTIFEITSKVHAISGDCGHESLKISSSDREILIKNTTLIFHFAATVKFTEKFKRAIEVNVRGTREIIKLAVSCENLQLFCHISTAYCQFNGKVLMEKFYEAPADPNEMIQVAEKFNVDEVEAILSKFLCEKIPNSYIFTKALSETLIEQAIRDEKLPAIICRPSIVIAMYKDPIPGNYLQKN